MTVRTTTIISTSISWSTQFPVVNPVFAVFSSCDRRVWRSSICSSHSQFLAVRPTTSLAIFCCSGEKDFCQTLWTAGSLVLVSVIFRAVLFFRAALTSVIFRTDSVVVVFIRSNSPVWYQYTVRRRLPQKILNPEAPNDVDVFLLSRLPLARAVLSAGPSPSAGWCSCWPPAPPRVGLPRNSAIPAFRG